MSKHKRKNKQRDVITIEEYQKQKEKEFGYTKQQMFNFDANILEDKKEINKTNYKRRSEIIELKKQILKLQREKNNYRSILVILSLISIVLLFIALIFLYIHIKYEPKYIEREKIVQDENIVFLGDSITQFYNLDKYYKNYNVVNSGVAGNKIDDILSDLKNRVYRYNPSKVILLIGINNIINDQNVNDIYDKIVFVVNEINKNRRYTKIYIQSVYPINESDNDKIFADYRNKNYNSTIRKLNSKLKNYCHNKKNIKYVDVYSKLIAGNQLKLEYTYDGLHLSEKGYDIITSKIKEEILEK